MEVFKSIRGVLGRGTGERWARFLVWRPYPHQHDEGAAERSNSNPGAEQVGSVVVDVCLCHGIL